LARREPPAGVAVGEKGAVEQASSGERDAKDRERARPIGDEGEPEEPEHAGDEYNDGPDPNHEALHCVLADALSAAASSGRR